MYCNLTCIQAHAYQDSKTLLAIYEESSGYTIPKWLKPHLRFPSVPAWLVLNLSHLTPEAQRKHYMMLRKRVSCFRLYGYYTEGYVFGKECSANHVVACCCTRAVRVLG